MRDSCEHIGAMSRRPFDAVSVVDTAFARLVIDVEVLKVVVEVDATRAKIATQKCCVGGEHSGDIDVALPA